MTQAVDVIEDAGSEAAFRDALVDKLLTDGMITTPAVETAFRRVPRARFTPAGTPLEVVYNADDAVATKRDQHGVVISSVSAPFIQAQMIEQAEIKPGMSVLEVGSGGYNAGPRPISPRPATANASGPSWATPNTGHRTSSGSIVSS